MLYKICFLVLCTVFLSENAVRALIPSCDSLDSVIASRQDETDELQLGSGCYAPCELDPCGTTPCGEIAALRDVDLPRLWDYEPVLIHDANNRSVVFVDADEQTLDKRFFRNRQQSTRFDREQMTAAQANRYLPLVFKKQDGRPDIPEGLEDGQYGPVQEFAHTTWDDVGHWIEQDERAVRRQATFGANAFQMGTSGLCGCTQVTLVSRRAVWMAHFWETYSHCDSDWVPSEGPPTAANGYPPGPDNTDHLASYRAFEERILNALSQQNPAGPTIQRGRKPKAYIMPEGPPIQANLFNRPDDGTMLFVMSPKKSSRDNTFRYSNRVPLIIDTIADILGRRPVEYKFPYLPFNMRVRRDRELAGQNKRGHALFQYDPDADGAGTRGWRLIYEGREWRGFLT